MRRWFWGLPAWAQRAFFIAGAVVSFGAAISMLWPPRNGGGFYSVFFAVSTGAYFVSRAFGGSRYKGLARAGERLGVPFDASTATLQGRVRGVLVRVVPDRGGKIVAYAPNGRGDLLKRIQKNDPVRGTSEQKIVETIESLVYEVERAQESFCGDAESGMRNQRRLALRKLSTIPADERIPRVQAALAAAAQDPDGRVRLTATYALGKPAADEATAIEVLGERSHDSVREAAAVLKTIGTTAALAPLVAARDLAPGEVENALAAIRARTGVEAGGLALSEAAPADGALSLAQRSETTLPLKR